MADQITRKVSDERQPGKSLEDNARGLVARSVREGKPLAEMALRETGETRAAILGLARAEFARLAGITLMQPAPEAEGEVPVEGVLNAIPEQEQLDERLTVCLEQLKGDFDRGIVRIEAKGTLESYAAALKADKTAGQTWEAIEAKLRANNAQKLGLAAAMPEGACLIGVYEDGEPAIRQRSREIVNVIVTKEGKRMLLPHAEAVQRVATTREQYAKAVEIVKGVKEAGYRVPADSPNYEKEGLVAASEAVMGGNYVESPVTSNPQDREWRSTMLECPENTLDSAGVRVVDFVPRYQGTCVVYGYARGRSDRQGAVLWL